ncbi:helix-turn-helix domain-containing protein [Paenibacillus ferrarius]|nr:helix-turn-helix transcriptional regulator [Paenibacillus ferrarius]
MMKYTDLLKEAIEKSSFSLGQLAEILNEQGLSVDKSYLSKLQNGKVPPANEITNKALAKLLNINEDKLIISAFFEKAPIELIQRTNRIGEIHKLLPLVRESIDLLKEKKTVKNESSMMIDVLMYQLGLQSYMSLNLTDDLIQLNELQRALYSEINSFVKDIIFPLFKLNDYDPLLENSRFIRTATKEMQMLLISATGNTGGNKTTTFSDLSKDEKEFLEKQLTLYRELKLKPMKE